MREIPRQENRANLAVDEALDHVREVETLEAEIETLNRGDREDTRIRRALGRSHHRLGIALKLAGVHADLARAHADLAVAEEVRTLRADLSVPDLVDPSAPLAPGNLHHCGDHCPDPCENDARRYGITAPRALF